MIHVHHVHVYVHVHHVKYIAHIGSFKRHFEFMYLCMCVFVIVISERQKKVGVMSFHKNRAEGNQGYSRTLKKRTFYNIICQMNIKYLRFFCSSLGGGQWWEASQGGQRRSVGRHHCRVLLESSSYHTSRPQICHILEK